MDDILARIRLDPVTGHGVVYTPRPLGPSAYRVHRHQKSDRDCPFCPGSEAMTPSEIFRIGDGDDWRVRVVPNRFAAVAPDEMDIPQSEDVLCERRAGRGVHEVIVDHCDHRLEMADFDESEMRVVLEAYRRRMRELVGGGLEYATVFKNYGAAAGASLEHTHSQIVALTFVPARAQDEFDGARRYFERNGTCAYCDSLRDSSALQIARNRSFAAVCPRASRLPFEVMILPLRHEAEFTHATDADLDDFGRMLKDVLRRIKETLDDPSFNFILHSSPLGGGMSQSFHWHLELVPKLIRTSAFEWGTDFYVNPTPPEIAARVLADTQSDSSLLPSPH